MIQQKWLQLRVKVAQGCKLLIAKGLNLLRGIFLIRDFFPVCGISQYVIFLSNRRQKFNRLGFQGDPPRQFPCLSGHPDLSMRKTLRWLVCLLKWFPFKAKMSQHVKLKLKKRRQFFYFLMVFNLLKIIHPFESKKHLRT